MLRKGVGYEWPGRLSVLARIKQPLPILLNGERKPEEANRIRGAAGGKAQIRVIPGATH